MSSEEKEETKKKKEVFVDTQHACTEASCIPDVKDLSN